MTSGELLNLLRARDVWCAPIRNSSQAMRQLVEDGSDLLLNLDHPEAGTVRAISCPIRMSATPATGREPAPLVGQHTDDVLAPLVGSERLAELRNAQAVA